VLDILENGKPLTGQQGLFASSCFDKATGDIILKIVNTSDRQAVRNIKVNTKKKISSTAKLTVLHSESLSDMNSIDKTDAVIPIEKEIKISGKSLDLDMEPYSFSVVRIHFGSAQ
jgi:alpha-L-arabinofuranosidase